MATKLNKAKGTSVDLNTVEELEPVFLFLVHLFVDDLVELMDDDLSADVPPLVIGLVLAGNSERVFPEGKIAAVTVGDLLETLAVIEGVLGDVDKLQFLVDLLS